MPVPAVQDMRLISRTHPGNIRRYDASNLASLHHMRLNFSRLKVDPYVPEGFRRKHLVRYRVASKDPVTLEELPQEPLFQKKAYNPTHGDIHREYPTFQPTEDTLNVVNEFVKRSRAKSGSRILVQAQRITCREGQEGLPSVEDWHQDDVEEVGIFVVTRKNIVGGESQFKDLDGHVVLADTVREGQFVIFEDASVQHRVTPIHVADTGFRGYRDVLLLSHGGCS